MITILGVGRGGSHMVVVVVHIVDKVPCPYDDIVPGPNTEVSYTHTTHNVGAPIIGKLKNFVVLKIQNLIYRLVQCSLV